MENTQVLKWFHNSIDLSIGMNFSTYNTTKKLLDYLNNMYLESDCAKQCKLEMSIRSATQNDKSLRISIMR